MTTPRFKKSIRKELLIRAGITVARKPGGWSTLTRAAIAREADCSEGLVSHSLGDMPAARRLIMKAAIRHEITEIIVQSLVAHDGYAIKKWLPTELKRKTLITLLGI